MTFKKPNVSQTLVLDITGTMFCPLIFHFRRRKNIFVSQQDGMLLDGSEIQAHVIILG